MALQKEIWVNDLIENLFADNTFAGRSVDHSGFVNDRTVHVPNAGGRPNVVKNRKTLPAQISEREDVDLHYDIDVYTTDPITIQHAEEVELSYSKRNSIISNSRAALQESVHGDLIYSWIPSSPSKVATSGSAAAAHVAGATGNRKAFTKADVLAVKSLFDTQDIPQAGRCILVDAVMYNQLLESLTETQASAFLASADAQRGVIGNLYGFDFYMRSQVAKTNASGAVKAWDAAAAATDSAAGIAWQSGCVSRALGSTELFENQGNALVYGDIISAAVRAGGHYMRNDKKGVCLIYQATA